jgi:hypothetical protein
VPDSYTELWEGHSIEFSVDALGNPEDNGVLVEGAPYAVEAICRCGHRWRLRGVTQITDIKEISRA